MITFAGVLDVLVLALGGFFTVHVQRRATQGPSETLPCQLVMGLVLFFAGFFLPGAFGLYFVGRWVTIPNAVLVSLILVAAAGAWARRHSPVATNGASASTRRMPPSPFGGTTRFLTATLTSGFAILAVVLLIGFPRGYEVHAYHLPIAVNIFRDGSLDIWDRAQMHTSPANMSLWLGFWLQLLPERLVSVMNFPFLGLCIFFLYRLCRLAGADRPAAGLITCGTTTVPLFGFGAVELGADLAGVGLVLAAIWVSLAQPRSVPTWPVLAGAASGLAFGFKSLHLVAAALLGLWILFGPDRSGDAPPGLRTRLSHAASYAAAFLALSGVWLLRNELEFGNPIYPVSLPFISDFLGFKSALDFQLQDRAQWEREWVSASWEWLIYPWVEGQFIHQNFKAGSGLGPFVAATLPAAWLFWSIIVVVSRAWRPDRSGSAPAILALYIFGTTTFVAWWMLRDHQPRYVMAGLGELLPLAAVLLASASGPLRRVYEMTLAAGILFMLAVLVLRLGVEEGSLLSLGRLPTRAEALEYPSPLDTLPADTVILDLDEDRSSHFQLYGAKLTNRVISNPEAVRLFRDGDAWNLKPQELRRLGVAYVYAAGSPKVLPGCVDLQPYAQLERNPFNSLPLPQPRILYRIDDKCPPHSG